MPKVSLIKEDDDVKTVVVVVKGKEYKVPKQVKLGDKVFIGRAKCFTMDNKTYYVDKNGYVHTIVSNENYESQTESEKQNE